MGCSSSRLDNAEAVQLCRDRKRFIEQAVEQRARFVAEHMAYIQSMKRVSAALRDYIEGDGPQQFLLDSFIMKKTSPGFMTTPSKSFSPQSQPSTTFTVNCLKSGGNSAVSVLERPKSPEIAHIQAYSPVHHCGVDGYFVVQSSPVMSSPFFSYSSSNRADLPPAVPQSSQWDFFWDPFSSLDYYGYTSQSSLDQMIVDDENGGLKQVQEEENDTKQEESCVKENVKEEKDKVDSNCSGEEDVAVENDKGKDDKGEEKETDCEKETEHEEKALQSQDSTSTEVAQSQNVEVEVRNQETAVSDGESKEETPNFTVYVNRRPTSMTEVIKDLEAQFTIICDSANEILTLIESSGAQYSSNSSESTAMDMLNPVALFHSASFADEGYESSSSDLSEKSCMLSGSHQSTLDRLYAWEKKLYEEVRAGEKVRIAYEKKYMQLRDQNVRGDTSSAVDKTRAAIRDLQTRIKVSKHSIEVVSSRIEALRDEELQPQLLELLLGLKRMWEAMAECHQSQKQALDETKIILAGSPSELDTKKLPSMTCTDAQRLARSAGNLETEIRNWRGCFESWINSQRSYMQAMAGWLLRCVQPDPNSSKLPFFSPRLSSGALPIFGMCIQWARSLDAIEEMAVLDGLDSLAARMGSLKSAERECGGNMEVDAAEEVKMAEVGTEALCEGLSVAINSLAEFSATSAEGYVQLVEQWEKSKVEA